MAGQPPVDLARSLGAALDVAERSEGPVRSELLTVLVAAWYGIPPHQRDRSEFDAILSRLRAAEPPVVRDVYTRELISRTLLDGGGRL